MILAISNNLDFVIRLFLVVLEVDIDRYLLSDSLLLANVDISYLEVLLSIADFMGFSDSRVISFSTVGGEGRLRITGGIKNNDRVLVFDTVDGTKAKSFKGDESLSL